VNPDVVFRHAQLDDRDWRLRREVAGRHTRLYEYAAGRNGGERVFVKRFPAAPTGQVDRRLEREFRALCVLQRKLGPELRSSLPAPVALLPAEHTLVISALPGGSLARLLKRDANRLAGFVRLAALRRCGRAVGEWLREFQARTEGRPLLHDHSRFSEALETDLEHFRGRQEYGALAAAVKRVRGASRRWAGRPLPAAGRHADFLPQNVLIGPGWQVGVVDFENYRTRDVSHMDPGSMFAYLAMLEERPVYRRKALRAFASGFTDGYGLPRAATAQNLFTAAAAVRIARDSPRPGALRDLVRTLSAMTL
jgi:hypothetical protein